MFTLNNWLKSAENTSFVAIFVITEYLLKKSALTIALMTMTIRRRLAAALTLMMLFATFTHTVMNLKVYAEGGKIDLFSNKVPFDGKGLNQRSDAFQPQELVELYARVTYNEKPITNWLVAFQVLNPLNKTVAIGVNWTNNNGIASLSFRIPWPSDGGADQEVFGDWKAVATVRIADTVFMDLLIFQVGWIVQIVDIKTLNAEYIPQTNFPQGETIVFSLTVKNIALTSKSAVVIIDVFDVIDCPIIHVIYAGMPVVFQHGESFIQVISKVPSNATVGRAVAYAVAYTALPECGGVAYSPPCITYFGVLPPRKAQFYLNVKTEPPSVVFIPGEGWYDEGANVSLTAPDVVPIFQGAQYKFKYWDVDGVALAGNSITLVMDKNHTATAHYSLQYHLTVVSSYGVVGGGGWYDANKTVYASLDIGVFDHGNGTRRVFVSWSGDASGTNYAKSNPILMDGPKTAIANWKTQHLLIVATDPADLSLQPSRSPPGEAGPANGWWYDEGTTVSLNASNIVPVSPSVRCKFKYWNVDGVALADSHTIIVMNAPRTVTAHYSFQYLLTVGTDPVGLKPQPSRNPFGEASSAEGWWYDAYVNVSLFAPPVNGYDFVRWVVDDIALEIGVRELTVFMDRPHVAVAQYSVRVAGWFLPEWFYWILLLILLLVIILLCIWIYRRRRKAKASEAAFKRGWTAWYYGYDLLGRNRRFR